MKHLIAAALVFASYVHAEDVPAPKQLIAICLVFTWSDTDGSSNTLVSKNFEFEIDKRITLIESASAIYQGVVSAEKPDQVFVDVLNKAGERIAGADDGVVLGVSIAEPNVQTQVACLPN